MQRNRQLQSLWSCAAAQEKQCSVYTILDGAKNTKIHPMINNSGLESVCLFEGKLEYAQLRSAPHIVRLEKHHDFSQELVDKAWARNWGIFVIAETESGISALRKHCRRMARVLGPNGKPLYFRYYDPSILFTILPVCSSEEVSALLGPFLYVFAGMEADEEAGWTVIYREANTAELRQQQNIIDSSTLEPAEIFSAARRTNLFQLRQAHMDVFEKKADLDFFKRIFARYLRCYNDKPGKTFVIDKHSYNLINYLWRCYPKGVEYKLENAYNFMVFFDLASQFGWAFWDKPEYAWATELLELPRPAVVRIAKLERRISSKRMERFWS